MPTTPTVTYSEGGVRPCQAPEEAHQIPVNLVASTTYAAGQVLGEVTATPGTYGIYADAGAGGLDVARVILQHACKTDAAGNVWMGDTVSVSEHGVPFGKYAPAWRSGIFQCDELVGLTAAAVADLGRLLTGTFTDGLLVVYGE